MLHLEAAFGAFVRVGVGRALRTATGRKVTTGNTVMSGSTVLCCVISLVFGAGAIACVLPAWAQSSAPPAPAKPAKSPSKATPSAVGSDAAVKDPEKAQRSYEAGVQAYQAGRHDEALNQLNTAIKAGGLAGPSMARALYYRGASFHAKSMPGQAISDLTSALWFKGGLDDRERAEATRIRSEAYRAAGLDAQGNATASAAPPAPANSAGISTGGNWAATPASTTPSPQLSAVPADTQGQSTNAGVDLGSILGGLFGGASKTIETAAVPRDSGSAASSPPVSGAVTASADGREILSWGAVAEPARGPITVPPAATEGQKPASAGTGKPAAKPVRPAAAAADGKFRIQVGSAKSEAEANALAAKAKDNPALAGAGVSVDPMAFGGSTFYRVRVGPYASAADTRGPCAALKTSGLDCLVTAQ